MSRPAWAMDGANRAVGQGALARKRPGPAGFGPFGGSHDGTFLSAGTGARGAHREGRPLPHLPRLWQQPPSEARLQESWLPSPTSLATVAGIHSPLPSGLSLSRAERPGPRRPSSHAATTPQAGRGTTACSAHRQPVPRLGAQPSELPVLAVVTQTLASSADVAHCRSPRQAASSTGQGRAPQRPADRADYQTWRKNQMSIHGGIARSNRNA